jgi:hypothetical protein
LIEYLKSYNFERSKQAHVSIVKTANPERNHHMKTLNRWWKALLYFLITGSTSVFIAACYGMPYKEGSWIVKVRDRQGAPVKGIEVTFNQYPDRNTFQPSEIAVDTTDDAGRAILTYISYQNDDPDVYDARLHDIDSTGNGGVFADTTINKGTADSTEVIVRKVQ